MKWAGRVVTDTLSDAGAVVLDDESTARVLLEDWLHDYYEIDDDEAECLSERLCAPVLTAEAREYATGRFGIKVEFDGEWSAERSAQAVHDYLTDAGEPVTMSRTAVSLGTVTMSFGDDRGESGEEALAGAWWRCGDDGEGWIMDESDAPEAAEYLKAVTA